MYHSTATLLPDGSSAFFFNLNSSLTTLDSQGSILVAGSNPNPDYTIDDDKKYKTEYRVEKFYPPYFGLRRPQPSGIPKKLGYGGNFFNITLSKDDLFGDLQHAKDTTVVLIRTGFSTHGIVRISSPDL